jgi:hypothetical protein
MERGNDPPVPNVFYWDGCNAMLTLLDLRGEESGMQRSMPIVDEGRQ